MLKSATEASGGLISIIPRDENGNVISDDSFSDYTVNERGTGTPIKEWYAIAMYINHLGGDMDRAYAETDGRKVVYESYSPAHLFSNANTFTYAFIGIVLLCAVIAAVVVTVTIILLKKRTNRKKTA